MPNKSKYKKLTVTIDDDLYDFLDYLMIEKKMNKSAIVNHLLRNGITATDDIYEIQNEFELKNYDMFIKQKQEHTDKKLDKTTKMPVIEKNDETQK